MPELKDVSGFLSEQQKKHSGETAQEWTTLEELYNKKLWHQLTLQLSQFVKNPIFKDGDCLLQLYHNFIADFEHRINPLSLVEIVLLVVKEISDPKEAIEFIEKIQEKVKTNKESVILCMTVHGNYLLLQRDMEKTKKLIAETEVELESLDGVTTVHGRYYELCSNYHKLMGNHAQYYRDALRFLGCVELSDLTVADQQERAFNLALAAVLGKGVYNFGELLAHDILAVLKDTDRSWLTELLYAFNSGNISKFDALKPQWGAQLDLAANELEMRRKISLLCLMEMTFKRPSTNRQMTFQEIAVETRLPLLEVELLVMRALSLDLVRGSIDQVQQIVHMTWVQPRVLDKQQIATMQKRLDQWCIDVKSMEDLVESKAQDILS